MKKKVLIVAVLLALFTVSAFAATATDVRCEAPILITTAGQNVDGSTVASLLKRVKITDYFLDASINPATIDWSKYNTLIVVIGGSGKGLGSAGISISEEETRAKTVIDNAKANGKKVITMHIGGQDRRGANSIPFLPYAVYGDLMIVNSNGNYDGYFTKLAADNNIPFIETPKNTEIATILQQVFGK